MRFRAPLTAILLAAALIVSPLDSSAQSDRDFVFTDLDGHLIIRFAGTGATGLDPVQADEVLNQEFSRMVHDRLRADLLFESERRDPDWSRSMAPQIARHVESAGLEFSNLRVECRAVSCRVIIEQAEGPNVPAHRAVLDAAQATLQDFIDDRRGHFEPVFMITAYYKEYQTPHIKAFLRRIDSSRAGQADGG